MGSCVDEKDSVAIEQVYGTKSMGVYNYMAFKGVIHKGVVKLRRPSASSSTVYILEIENLNSQSRGTGCTSPFNSMNRRSKRSKTTQGKLQAGPPEPSRPHRHYSPHYRHPYRQHQAELACAPKRRRRDTTVQKASTNEHPYPRAWSRQADQKGVSIAC